MGEFTGFNDESVGKDKGEIIRFDVQKGKKERIVVMDKEVYSEYMHFAGRFFRCVKDISATCPGCTMLKTPAKKRWSVNVLWYDSDRDGNIITPVKFKIAMWSFGADKYASLRDIFVQYKDLRKVDLIVNLLEEEYKKMSIVVAPECYYLKNRDAAMIDAVSKKTGCYDIPKIVSKIYDTAEMEEMLINYIDNGGQLDNRNQKSFGQRMNSTPAKQLNKGTTVDTKPAINTTPAPVEEEFDLTDDLNLNAGEELADINLDNVDDLDALLK